MTFAIENLKHRDFEDDDIDTEYKIQEIGDLLETFYQQLDSMMTNVSFEEKYVQERLQHINSDLLRLEHTTSMASHSPTTCEQLLKLKEAFLQAQLIVDTLQERNERIIESDNKNKYFHGSNEQLEAQQSQEDGPISEQQTDEKDSQLNEQKYDVSDEQLEAKWGKEDDQQPVGEVDSHLNKCDISKEDHLLKKQTQKELQILSHTIFQVEEQIADMNLVDSNEIQCIESKLLSIDTLIMKTSLIGEANNYQMELKTYGEKLCTLQLTIKNLKKLSDLFLTFNHTEQQFKVALENEESLSLIPQLKDDLVSTIEMIDEQQVVVMSNISPDDQDKVYSQLETIQDTYVDILEQYASYVEEVTSKCIANLVIYDVMLQELKQKLYVYKSAVATDKTSLDALIELKDILQSHKTFMNENLKVALTLKNLDLGDEFEMKVMQSCQLVQDVNTDMCNVFKLQLPSKQEFTNEVCRMDSTIQCLYQLEASGELNSRMIEEQQSTVDRLKLLYTYHDSLPNNIPKIMLTSQLNLDQLAMKMFKNDLVGNSVEVNDVETDMVIEKSNAAKIRSKTHDTCNLQNKSEEIVFMKLRSLTLEVIENVVEFTQEKTDIKKKEKMVIEETFTEKVLNPEKSSSMLFDEDIDSDTLSNELTECRDIVEISDIPSKLKNYNEEVNKINRNLNIQMSSDEQQRAGNSKVTNISTGHVLISPLKAIMPETHSNEQVLKLPKLLHSKELLPVDRSDSEDHYSSVASLISESSGVYSADPDDKLQFKTDIFSLKIHDIIAVDRNDIAEESDSTVVDELNGIRMNKATEEKGKTDGMFSADTEVDVERKSPYNSPIINRHQFVENWAASIHGNVSSRHVDDKETKDLETNNEYKHILEKQIGTKHAKDMGTIIQLPQIEQSPQTQTLYTQLKPSIQEEGNEQITNNENEQDKICFEKPGLDVSHAVCEVDELVHWSESIYNTPQEGYVVNMLDDETVPSKFNVNITLVNDIPIPNENVQEDNIPDTTHPSLSGWECISEDDLYKKRASIVEEIPAELIDSIMPSDMFDKLEVDTTDIDLVTNKQYFANNTPIVNEFTLQSFKLGLDPLLSDQNVSDLEKNIEVSSKKELLVKPSSSISNICVDGTINGAENSVVNDFGEKVLHETNGKASLKEYLPNDEFIDKQEHNKDNTLIIDDVLVVKDEKELKTDDGSSGIHDRVTKPYSTEYYSSSDKNNHACLDVDNNLSNPNIIKVESSMIPVYSFSPVNENRVVKNTEMQELCSWSKEVSLNNENRVYIVNDDEDTVECEHQRKTPDSNDADRFVLRVEYIILPLLNVDHLTLLSPPEQGVDMPLNRPSQVMDEGVVEPAAYRSTVGDFEHSNDLVPKVNDKKVTDDDQKIIDDNRMANDDYRRTIDDDDKKEVAILNNENNNKAKKGDHNKGDKKVYIKNICGINVDNNEAISDDVKPDMSLSQLEVDELKEWSSNAYDKTTVYVINKVNKEQIKDVNKEHLETIKHEKAVAGKYEIPDETFTVQYIILPSLNVGHIFLVIPAEKRIEKLLNRPLEVIEEDVSETIECKSNVIDLTGRLQSEGNENMIDNDNKQNSEATNINKKQRESKSVEDVDVISLADKPSFVQWDKILDEVLEPILQVDDCTISFESFHGTNVFPSFERPSLFSELTAAEGNIAKDIVFEKTADHLYQSLIPSDSDNKKDFIADGSSLMITTSDDVSSNDFVVDLPRSSTPLCVKEPKVQTNSKLVSHPVETKIEKPYLDLHEESNEIKSIVIPPDSTTSYSDYVLIKPTSVVEDKDVSSIANENQMPSPEYVSMPSNDNTIYKSPLYGKNDFEKVSPFEGFQHETDLGVDGFFDKIQSCMLSMMEITKMINQESKQMNFEEGNFNEQLQLLSQLGSHQSKVDSLNMLGKQIKDSGNESVNERVQEKLNTMNKNWKVLQERTLSQAQMPDVFPEEEQLDVSFVSSNSQSLPVFSPVRAHSPDSEDERMELQGSQQQAHLKYQLLFTELFDWLSSCDERLSEPMPQYSSVEILKSRIFGLQSISFQVCLHIPHINRLEDAWSNLFEVNQSLSDQHHGVFLLWMFITEKIHRKAKLWYKVSKEFLEKEDVVNSTVIFKWFEDLEKSMNIAEQVFSNIENKNGITVNGKEAENQALLSILQTLSTNFKIANQLLQLTDIDENQADEVWKMLYNLQEHLRLKDVSFSNDCCFNLDSSGDEQNVSPQMPNILMKKSLRHTQKFDGSHLFLNELERFELYIKSERNQLLNRPDKIPRTTELMYNEILLYQSVAQSIKAKELPLKFLYIQLNINSHQSLHDHYNSIIESSEALYDNIMAQLNTITMVHFLMLSLEGHKLHLFSWFSKTFEQFVNPLIEKPEENLEKVIMKLMKLSEIEKRFSDQMLYKEKTILEANKLLKEVDNEDIKSFTVSTNERWNNLYDILKSQRHRLDAICSTWREFCSLADHLEQWLSLTLVSVQTNLEHCNMDSVHTEQAVLQNIEEQFKTKQKDKETLKKFKENVVSCINNKPCKSIENEMDKIETLWLELKKVMHERMRHLQSLSDEVEWNRINEMMLSLTKAINNGEELLEKYTSRSVSTLCEMDDAVRLLETSFIELNDLQPNLEILLQIADNKKWYNKYEFQKDLTLLHSGHTWLIKNISEQLSILKPLQSNVHEMGDVISDCENQLKEMNASLSRCFKLKKLENIQRYEADIKLACEVLSNIEKSVNYIKSTSLKLSTNIYVARIDTMEQSKQLLQQFTTTKLKIVDLKAKLKGYESYKNIGPELDYLQEFLFESQRIVDIGIKFPLESKKMISFSKKLKDLQKEMAFKKEQLGTIKDTLSTLNSDDNLNMLLTSWHGTAVELTEQFCKLHNVVVRKEDELTVLSQSIMQYEEDYNYLKSWLNEKEQQYEQLLKSSKHLDRYNPQLIDRCKKLKADMPIFITFFNSMTALFENKNKRLSHDNLFSVESQTDLKERYKALESQINHLCDRLIGSKSQNPSNYQVVLDTIQEWLTKVEDDQGKTFSSLQVYQQYLHDTATRCENLQEKLNDILKSANFNDEEEAKKSIEGLSEKLETLLSSLETHMKDAYAMVHEVKLFKEKVDILFKSMDEYKSMIKDGSLMSQSELLQNEKANIETHLQNIKATSDKIYNNTYITSEIKTELESNLIKLAEKWSQIMTDISNMNQLETSNMKAWNEFEIVSKQLVKWMSEMKIKLKNIDILIQKSSVETLKVCFKDIMALKNEITSQTPLYNELIAVSNPLMKTNNEIATNVVTIISHVKETWNEIELSALQRVTDLKDILYRWADYTESMKELMKWLRDCEHKIRQPLHKLPTEGLERKLLQYQAISKEIESHRSKHESIKVQVACLSRVTVAEEQYILQHQMISLSELWMNISQELKEKMKVLVKLLQWIEKFSYNLGLVDTWLNGIENSVFSENMTSSPEKQQERIKHIYGNDMKRNDIIRGDLKSIAIHILSHGSTCIFAGEIQEKLANIDDRWRLLCEKLGMTYKKAEETLFLLKLFEEMLKQLTDWLNNVSKGLQKVKLDSCLMGDIQCFIKDLDILIIDFDNRDHDFNSLNELCKSIQESPEACPYIEDLTKLLDCSDAFKTRWTETRTKSHMYKSFMKNRLAIYYEWLNDAKLLSSWLEKKEEIMSHSSSHYLNTSSDIQKFESEYSSAKKSIDRMKKSLNHMTNSSTCVDSYKLSQTTKKIISKFEKIVSEYHSVKTELEEKQIARSSFNEIEREVESWLTGMEVQMIELQPYTSESDIEEQKTRLQHLNSEIKEKSVLMEDLNTIYKKTSPTGIVRQGIVEELNERYEQVLNNSASWLLDLTLPHFSHVTR